MDNKIVFVKNCSRYGSAYTATKKVKLVDDTGRDREVRVPDFTKTFDAERIDRDTGQVLSTGFLDITVEEFEKLMESSRLFRNHIETGVLKKFDEEPAEALSDSRLLNRTRDENSALREENARLKSLLAGSKSSLGKTSKKSSKAVEPTSEVPEGTDVEGTVDSEGVAGDSDE